MLFKGTQQAAESWMEQACAQDSPAGMTTVWAGFEQPHRAHCVQTCMQA
jgi:hypothetical protein